MCNRSFSISSIYNQTNNIEGNWVWTQHCYIDMYPKIVSKRYTNGAWCDGFSASMFIFMCLECISLYMHLHKSAALRTRRSLCLSRCLLHMYRWASMRNTNHTVISFGSNGYFSDVYRYIDDRFFWLNKQ